jgi:RNA polymerase subunit RPABC4/transcription elongation factor Spt4
MSEKRICPICGKEYTDAPAVSRKDGSDICLECGAEEALDDWFWANYRKEIE